MHRFSAAITAISLCVSSPAAQEDFGCFRRTYDNTHLAANPHQNVRDIMVHFTQPEDIGFPVLDMRILFRDDPREFAAMPTCYLANGQVCGIDCDGGTISQEVLGDGRLRLTTQYLRAETDEPLSDEGGCAGPLTRSIADGAVEGAHSDNQTVFILYPRDERECAT